MMLLSEDLRRTVEAFAVSITGWPYKTSNPRPERWRRTAKKATEGKIHPGGIKFAKSHVSSFIVVNGLNRRLLGECFTPQLRSLVSPLINV
jgi:hypothetical protein